MEVRRVKVGGGGAGLPHHAVDVLKFVKHLREKNIHGTELKCQR